MKIENLQEHYNNVNKENYSTKEKMMNIKLKAVMGADINTSKLNELKQNNTTQEHNSHLKGNIGVVKTNKIKQDNIIKIQNLQHSTTYASHNNSYNSLNRKSNKKNLSI